jgi:hypothetical protein
MKEIWRILVAMVLFIAVLILPALVHKLSYIPHFEVKSVRLVNDYGIPSFRISFNTSDYPIYFYLLTPEGERIDLLDVIGPMANPDNAIDLHLIPCCNYTNIIGPKKYVIKAYYENKELWSSVFEVKGAKANLKIADVEFNASSELSLRRITLEIKNEGDVSLRLEDLKLYLDYSCEPFAISPSTPAHDDILSVPPGNSSRVNIHPSSFISSKHLDEEHRIVVMLPRIAEASYIIKPLKPELRIRSVGVRQSPEGLYMDNITLTILNTWNYPINIRWLELYVNGKPASYWIPSATMINPGEERNLTLYISSMKTQLPVMVSAKLGGVEVFYLYKG